MVFLDGYKIGADSSNMKVFDWDKNTQIRLRFGDIAGGSFWFLFLLLLVHPAHNDYDCVFVLTNMFLRVGEHFVNWCYE